MDYTSAHIAKHGGHRYKDGSVYVGSWGKDGKRHGEGHMRFHDGARYDGNFEDGLFDGLGVIVYPDGAKYEGEFLQGWFHGHGIFWRADGMRFEGGFCGGNIWGLGVTTFNDGTNGFPVNEGFHKNCRLVQKKKCPEAILKAQQASFNARSQYVEIQ